MLLEEEGSELSERYLCVCVCVCNIIKELQMFCFVVVISVSYRT
jgi:hypothetical protein